MPILIILLIIAIAIIIHLTRKTNKYQKTELEDQCDTKEFKTTYIKKKYFLSETEKNYLELIKDTLTTSKYIIQPQVNLASIINCKDFRKYHSELFRNIDFGIFDYNYNIKALIEINDKTHYKNERKERDIKVQYICKQAEIPLIVFWIDDDPTLYDIKKEFKKIGLIRF